MLFKLAITFVLCQLAFASEDIPATTLSPEDLKLKLMFGVYFGEPFDYQVPVEAQTVSILLNPFIEISNYPSIPALPRSNKRRLPLRRILRRNRRWLHPRTPQNPTLQEEQQTQEMQRSSLPHARI